MAATCHLNFFLLIYFSRETKNQCCCFFCRLYASLCLLNVCLNFNLLNFFLLRLASFIKKFCVCLKHFFLCFYFVGICFVIPFIRISVCLFVHLYFIKFSPFFRFLSHFDALISFLVHFSPKSSLAERARIECFLIQQSHVLHFKFLLN